MTKLLTCLLTVFIVTTAIPLKADPLGNEDDTYIGLQFSIPLASKPSGLFSQQSKVSLLLVDQNSDVKDGIALTLDGSGNQTWGYIRPSTEFDIGSSNLSRHIIPIASFDDKGESTITSFDGFDLFMMTIIGTAYFIHLYHRNLQSV